MARALTNGEKIIQRYAGQWSELYLAIAKYNTVYTARLNGVPTSNDKVYQITYDGGSGTLADVKTGMTLYAGTSAGARDLGMCRIRATPSATIFYIGLTSEIEWADDAYLTVVDDFGLWVKPTGVSGGAVLMDTNVAYSDQHTSFDPVPVLGTHAVLWLTGATVNAAFTASDSWVIGSTISAYLWEAPGASATANLNTATPTITYNAAGFYRVYCTVTAANGKTFLGVRHVFVYTEAAMPATAFQVTNLGASYEAGGWAFDVTMFAEADQADVRDGALAILFRKDYFNGAEQAAPGPLTNRENIECVGWIAGESIQHNFETGSVSFRVDGAAEWLKRMDTYLVNLAMATNTVTAWARMPAMTIQRALWHILHWRTTVTRIMDVTLMSDTRYIGKVQSPANSVWQQLNEIAGRIFANCGVDRYGRLFAEIEPQMVSEASRTWAVLQDIETQDWAGELRWRRDPQNNVGMVVSSSELVNVSGKSVNLYSLALGHVHTRHGRAETMNIVPLASDQTQSNELAGLYAGWKNNRWPSFDINMASNYCMVDLWPHQWFTMTIATATDLRGVGYTGHVIPRNVTRLQNINTGWVSTSLTLEAETFGTLAMNGDKPAGTGIYTPPPPPPPPPPPIDPGDVPLEGPHNVLIATSDKGLLYTLNAHEASPSWFFMNAGLTEYQSNNVWRIKVCPSGLILIAIKHITAAQCASVYYAEGLGSAWTLLIDDTMVEQGDYGTPAIVGMGVNKDKNEEILVVGGGFVSSGFGGVKKTYLGDRSGLTMVDGNLVLANTFGDVSFGVDGWFGQCRKSAAGFSPAWYSLNADGTINTAITNFSPNFSSDSLHHRANGKVYMPQQSPGVTELRVMINNTSPTGETILTMSFSPTHQVNSVDVSPSGNYLVGCESSTIAQRSSDGGTTWGNVGGALSVGYTVAGNGGNDLVWFLGTAQKVMRTMDWGNTWVDKSGNLPYLAPLCDIKIIKCIG